MAKHQTIRKLNDSSGILVCRRNQMASPRVSFGSSRTPSGVHRQPPSHTSNLRVQTLQTVHRANFGSPLVRVTATESLRTLTECFRTLTSLFGSSTGLFGVHRTPSGVRRQPHHSNQRDLDRSHRIRRTTCRVCESLGSPLVRDDSHRVSPDTHRNLRAPLDLSEIRCQLSKVSALRRQSRYKDHFARGILHRTVHPT